MNANSRGGGGRNPGRVIFFNLTRSTGNGHILECGLTTIPFVLQKANIDVLFHCGTRLCISSKRVIKYIIEHSAFSFLISSLFSCAFLLYLPSSSHRRHCFTFRSGMKKKHMLRIGYCGFGPFCSTGTKLLLMVLICIIYTKKDN